MISEKIHEYIESHPRESLFIVVTLVFCCWQTFAFILGLILYVVFKQIQVDWKITIPLGIVGLFASILLHQGLHINFIEFLRNGFNLNLQCWKYIITNDFYGCIHFLVNDMIDYLIGTPLLFAGSLSLIGLISDNPHRISMKALQRGINLSDRVERSEKEINKALNKLRESEYDGTVLGVSKYTGNYVVLPDHDINQVLLLLGTTGAGKTITLRRFYKRAISRGYPLIIVDGKPDENNVDWLMKMAEQHGRQFIGFNCGNYLSYDPLAHGGYTELKDKIISLKDEWSSDYYRSIAEDYLQTTFEVLIKSGIRFDLREVANCLNYDELANWADQTLDQKLKGKVLNLKRYDIKDITGLQAHLNILLNSELGQFFEKNEKTFSLHSAIHNNAVVYFALPALRFPSFSKVLGKLIINDLKAVIDRNVDLKRRIFTIFDEFSVFAGEQVLNLVNMGRGKGVHAVFGTQGLADLDRVDQNFKNQILNCVNSLICHRLNDQASAEGIANWIGTRDAFTVTAQLNVKQNDAEMGSVRKNKEFIVHPDSIKQELLTGETFYVSKIRKFRCEKITVYN